MSNSKFSDDFKHDAVQTNRSTSDKENILHKNKIFWKLKVPSKGTYSFDFVSFLPI
jgi:hypothetical protein